MQMKTLLRDKKAGRELSQQQIQFWVQGVADEKIPDYQTTALLMAICFNGMSVKERGFLTMAMRDSGTQLKFDNAAAGFIIDKHSSGGVGDKTSLNLSPLMAACQLRNPMISGRGLGFTGGTLDKLESVRGFNVNLSLEEMNHAIATRGYFMAGQTPQIAPADKKLYGLRDVTETVDEMSLITASILSKKLSEGLQGLVLDIKCGKGAFMKNLAQALELSQSLVSTTNSCGVKSRALITQMDIPLGAYTGNLCEVYECYQLAQPDSLYYQIARDKIHVDPTQKAQLRFDEITSPLDELTYLTVALGVHALMLSGAYNALSAYQHIMQLWQSAQWLAKFEEMIAIQGGNLSEAITRFEPIHSLLGSNDEAENVFHLRAPVDGFVTGADGEAIGNFMVGMGAGRAKFDDVIDPLVSMRIKFFRHQPVKKGDVLLSVFTNGRHIETDKQETLLRAIEIRPQVAGPTPLILDVIEG